MNEANKFSDLQTRIKKFCTDRDWDQFHDPKNLAISLQLEASEVLEIFQWTKDNQAKDSRAERMPEELADVLYWTMMLANHYGIDLITALDEKMDQNEVKYPVVAAFGKSDKYNEL